MDNSLAKTFAALKVRNFRLFIFGQGISLCGTWMQTVGLSWLVLKITHSGTQLGLVIAAQFIPILILGAWGGVVADRFNKRKILYFTQSTAGLLALTLGLLVVTGTVHLWMIYVIAMGFGLVAVVDNPSRQAFVMEMVGPDRIRNAVTLNSTMVNAARVIGPAIAGVLIATVGTGQCFIVNAASYVAVLIALKLMIASELHQTNVVERQPGQVKAGLKYVWNDPQLKTTLMMMFIIGTLAYEFTVVLPLFATVTLHGNASTYSAMTVAAGVGAILGGLYTAGKASSSENELLWSGALFGLSILVVSIAPNFIATLITLVIMGAFSVIFIALGNTALQLGSSSEMRGRVMALWSIAFLGTTPIGGPIIGAISDKTNPRIGLAVGGFSSLLAAGLGYVIYTKTAKKAQSPPLE